MEVTVQKRIAQRERPAHARPVMYQKWRALLFLHWAFGPLEVQKTLPPGLFVDSFEGKAYIGIVPFFMRAVRPRFLPAVPGISNFMELNLRTYVYDDRGIPGVWFYSLDANNRIAVQTARTFFGLPYFNAQMRSEIEKSSGWVYYSSLRNGFTPAERSSFRYRKQGQNVQAQSDSLEFFLVERYVLFSYRNGRLLSGRVHHPPYPLLTAEAQEWDNHLFELDGLNQPKRPPDHCLFSQGVDVEIYPLEELS